MTSRLAVVVAAGALAVTMGAPAGAADLPIEVAAWRLVSNGDTIDALPVRTPVKLIVTLENTTSQRLQRVRAYAAEFLEGMAFGDRWVEVGDIPAHGTGDATYSLVYGPGRCTSSVFVVLQFEPEQNGYPQIDIPTNCPGPDLVASVANHRFSGGDGDNLPEPGETLSFRIELFNNAGEPARDLSATLDIATSGVEVVQGHSTWPDMATHAYQESTQEFIVRIARDVPRAEGFCGRIGNQPFEMAVKFAGSLDIAFSGTPLRVPFESGVVCRVLQSATGAASPSPSAEPTREAVDPRPQAKAESGPGRPAATAVGAVLALSVAVAFARARPRRRRSS